MALVKICARCGKGMIGPAQDAQVDTQPMWFFGSGAESEGGLCRGRLMFVNRDKLIDTLDRVFGPQEINTSDIPETGKEWFDRAMEKRNV